MKHIRTLYNYNYYKAKLSQFKNHKKRIQLKKKKVGEKLFANEYRLESKKAIKEK